MSEERRIKLLAYVHGPMIEQILAFIGVESNRISRDVIKAFLKKAHGIDSMGALDARGLSLFIEQSAILLATEIALSIDLPGEDNIQEMDMKDFFKTIYG